MAFPSLFLFVQVFVSRTKVLIVHKITAERQCVRRCDTVSSGLVQKLRDQTD